MIDPSKDLGPPGWLIFGIFLLGLGVVGLLTGESLVRFRGVIYRANEPREFWESIATDFLCGSLLIGAYAFNLPANDLISVVFVGTFVYIVYLLIRPVIRQKTTADEPRKSR
jgi:hypothetical protein